MSTDDDKLSVFPVFFRVAGRFAIVVGNGAEAVAKARLLKESRIAVRVVAPAPSRDLGVFMIQADIHHIAQAFAPDMLDGTMLVFAATGSRDEDEQIVAAARKHKIPVNAVDRPELCDFFTPALVSRAPVAIAIGSEGAGPVLTQIIRARIEAMLPHSIGMLARLAASYRATVDRLVPRGAARRLFWRRFFQGPVADALEKGEYSNARRAVTRLLKEPFDRAGFVSMIDAGSGAPELLTLRAQQRLMDADIIMHDPLVPDSILAMGRRDARRVCVSDFSKFFNNARTGDAVETFLVSEAGAGQRIVRIRSSVSSLAGQADNEIRALHHHAIAFEIVPGAASDPAIQTEKKTASGSTRQSTLAA
jgi:uroporphyrin-III C-methyltransferase / precorrin-2 dehydrogenase / sirohydrochlorin ferrochelatase